MDAREQVREAIRAEVARQNPVEDARNSLELIAETAVRFDGEGSAGYRIIDENGEPRTRVENERVTEFTIRDLVAELREKHPSLFRAAPATVDESAEGGTQGGPGTDGLETGAPADHDFADADLVPVPNGNDSAREPAMPVAAPFGNPLSGSAPVQPAAEPRDAEPSAAIAEPRQAPRDWLILDGGEPRAAAPANPPSLSGTAPSRDPDPRGPSRDPVRPALAGSVPPTAPAAASDPVANGPVANGPVANGRARGARRPASIAYAVLGGLAILSTGAYLALGSRGPGPDLLPKQAEKSRAKTPVAQPPADPVATGSVASAPAGEPKGPGPAEPGAVTGVPEVIDTATLRIGGKLVRLVGVEWARGGRAENLTSYLAGREVTCEPAAANDSFRCKVEGRDLSQVVLYNGGGRASPNAPADLLAAENYARTERIGVWQK